MSPFVESRVPDSDGWRASLDLGFEQRAGRTLLATKRQRGPLAVQRPFYPEGGVCHLYLLHPPGGVVGGDGLEIVAAVGAGAHALLTTPAATKFYRSAGALATQHQRLGVCDGGVLEWFPQDNILFPGAQVCLRTEVELSGTARFIGWEIHSLGRPANGERFDRGAADLGLSIRRDGRPLLMERLRLSTAADLEGASGLRGCPVSATLIASGANAEDLAAARGAAPIGAGVAIGITLVGDLLLARCLGPAVEPVMRIFGRLWGILRPRLLGREPCPPRIWAT